MSERDGSRPVRPDSVRVRFPPSPTGDLHVGNVRSALFNWAFARHHGGAYVLRIEDTDRARSTEESYRGVLDELHWLGLDWDEGPEVGGPYAPYRQSERLELYTEVARKLHEAGYAYESYSTDVEVRARRAAKGDKTPGYDNHDRTLTAAEIAAFRAEGRQPVLRFRMPDEPVVFSDLIRGEVRFEPANVPDFVLVRADGFPLYPLVNPVDDAVMRITHVLRGEDLLSSTPRQIPLHAALRTLGVADGPLPLYGHLPFVLGDGNQKLSKRATGGSLAGLRSDGYLAEGVLNYLALLGWSMGADRELFTLAEMAEAFTLEKVSRNPARFDLKKLTVINGVKIRELEAAGVRPPVAALPGPGRAARRAGDRRAARPGGGRGTAGPGAVRHPGRGGRAARFPARPRPPLRGRPGRRGQGAHRRRRAGPRRGHGGAGRPARLDRGGYPGGAAGRAGRDARAEAAGRVRAGAGRRDRADGLAAALRVARAARPRPHPRPAPGGPCRFGVDSGDGLTSAPGAPSRWALRLGYGVIGSPTDSGSVSLGSSPGTPAPQHQRDTARPRRLEAQDAALSRR